MKILSRLGSTILLVIAIGVLVGGAATFSAARPVDAGLDHSSNLRAKITVPDGSSRSVTVQGVGCNVSLCSRVAVRSTEPSARLAALGLHRDISTWLDSLAAIKDITKSDALFVFKDGSTRRLSIVDGNRFFYFANAHFGSGKIDVMKVRSIEFLPGRAE
ncbi:MAG TPA: hypothetical protein VIY49_33150 [Bryobacteraceae bacterium]